MSMNYIHVLCNRNSQFTGLHNMAAATPASAATAIIVEAYYVLSMYMEFNDYNIPQLNLNCLDHFFRLLHH